MTCDSHGLHGGFAHGVRMKTRWLLVKPAVNVRLIREVSVAFCFQVGNWR